MRFEKNLGIENVCLVAVSVYGNDNRSLLSALHPGEGMRTCRGVISFDPHKITEGELDKMHLAGVRGVRLNLKSTGETPTQEQFAKKLHSYAARLRARGWILQLYVGLEQVAAIADIVPRLGVKVVIDHMGSPDPSLEASLQPGRKELFDLLANGKVWVKISGVYRFAELPDLDSYARELIQAGPENVVWASDWPHTGGPLKMVDGQLISSYRQVQIEDFIQKCFEWCDNDKRLIEKLFVDNPRRLWLT